MNRHRTTARGVLVVLAAALAAGSAAASAGKGGVPDPFVFPVVGPVAYSNDFGAPRPQGPHQGNDIMAPRRAVAVATEDGKIKLWTTSARAGCMLYLYGVSGTTYLYIHLNNDLTQGNHNRGKCVQGVAYWPGLKDGAKVAAGQPIGYVGDSGDADGTPHLHFEVHPHDGPAKDPFPHLNKATHLLFAAPKGSAVTLSLTGSVVAADASSLSVKVDQATVFPLGLVLSKLAKPLKLALPANAIVDPGNGSPTGLAVQLTTSLVGKPVIVLTEPSPTSLETETGKDGAFSAARIVLKPA
jgi:murein DD-endopeptidase MepM/ murein hydrolase activator NlpD